MARVAHQIRGFGGGEIAPELFGRTDIEQYARGAARIENFVVRPEGGAHRRPGTRFVAEVDDSTKASRLVPFVYSETQAYILEFSEYKIGVFANEGQVECAAQTFAAVPYVDTITEEFHVADHGYVHGQGPLHMTTDSALPTTTPQITVGLDLYASLPAASTWDANADVVSGTDTIDTTSAHGYVSGQGPFRVTVDGATTGYITGGLQGFLDYYVIVVDSTHIQLALTRAAALVPTPINLTAATSSGTNTLTPTPEYMRDSLRLSTTSGGTPMTISAPGSVNHTLTPNPAGDPTGLALEITTTYTEAEVVDLKFAQSADVLYIAHGDHRPAQLVRLGATQWELNDFNYVDGPYYAINATSADTATATATTGFTLLTASTADTFAEASNIGRIIRQFGGATWGYAEIVAVSSSAVWVEVLSDFESTGASATWQLGAWYPGSYPRALSFFEQRLAWAGEADGPQSMHGSELAIFNGFSPTQLDDTVVDTNAVNFTIGVNQVNSIRWMALGNRLVIGTSSGVFVARGSFDGEPITPSNIQVQRVSAVGALNVQPVVIGDQVVYVTANSRSVRALRVSPDAAATQPTDLTVLAKHILGRSETVRDMDFQQDRQQTLWIVRGDGELAALTYVPEYDVFAWHRHILGGSFDGGDPVVESVAVIPAPDGTHDQVWITVKRTVNSATVRHVEFFEDEWNDGVNTSMHFVDCAPVAYSGSPVSSITGLDHLEGETVQVLADGLEHDDRTVSSGSITLDASYSDVVVGLQYTSELESLPIDLPDPEGSSMGKAGRIDHIVLRLYETVGGQVGYDTSNLDDLSLDGAPVAFTGDHKAAFGGGHDIDKRFVVRQDKPLPFNLLGVNLLAAGGQR